jgi:hypothetical protein
LLLDQLNPDRLVITIGSEVPMKTLYRFLIGFAISALLPSAAAAQKVRYDFGPDTDFSHLRTYAIKDSGPTETVTEQTTMYDSPFVRERTYDAIAAQLESRGMRRDDRNPDVYVTARRSFKTEYVTYGSYYPAWGWGYPYDWGWYGGYRYGGPAYTEEVVVGTLTVDMQTAANGDLIWRGSAEKTVHDTSKPEKRTKRVNKEVAKIFRNFPPDRTEADDDDDDDVND